MTLPVPAAAPPAPPTPAPTPSWREASEAVPPRFLAFVAVVAAVGFAAGVLAAPALLWTTPVVAVLLVVGATQTVREHAGVVAAARLDLPADVAPLLAETLERLTPAGDAHALLADVARLASSLYAGTARAARTVGVADGGVGELVAAACDCALALERADTAAALLREHALAAGVATTATAAALPNDAAAAATALADRRRAAAEECERSRDALRERLLEAVTALGAACAQDAGRAAGGDDANRLTDIARDLAHDAELRRAASDEVEALLRDGSVRA